MDLTTYARFESEYKRLRAEGMPKPWAARAARMYADGADLAEFARMNSALCRLYPATSPQTLSDCEMLEEAWRLGYAAYTGDNWK